MSYLPSQSSVSLVQQHAKRHARSKLNRSYAQILDKSRVIGATVRGASASRALKNEVPMYRHGRIQGDYFSRLVDSSPKPRVLRSAHHPVAIHLLKLANSAAYRKYRKLILLTSAKLIREYCDRHGTCSRIYTTSHDNPLLLEPKIRADKVLICSKKLLQKVAGLHSYEGGILAEVPYTPPSQHLGNAALVLCVAPSTSPEKNATASSLMRTAQALQWQAIWLLKHGAHDFLDPLSIRASQNCLDTMPYISGDVNEALVFANENRLLLCICGYDGDPLETDHIQRAMKQHHGIMLLVGKQPQELIDAAIKIDITIPSRRTRNTTTDEHGTETQHYKLDGFTKSCIFMYLVRKRLHYTAPRSPYFA
ncbi:hypothetical protein X943_001079 [Babesia divergens]|uniref:Uncharacterized protein n=1 Tax=Babesia divergens TaxID=32595 RepID=A0AAD9LJC0_BABDI|nr:hypothetical protein X943_001079 [Babesia divergens]